MRRRVVQIWNTPGGVTTALLVVSCAFVSGGIAGLLVASQVAGEGQTTLAAYIESYLAAAQQRTAAAPGFFAVALDLLRWPCLAVFMGFLSLGVVGVPILFAVRGFLLSFAVSSFVRMFGGAGGMLAFSAFGLTDFWQFRRCSCWACRASIWPCGGCLQGRGRGALSRGASIWCAAGRVLERWLSVCWWSIGRSRRCWARWLPFFRVRSIESKR